VLPLERIMGIFIRSRSMTPARIGALRAFRASVHTLLTRSVCWSAAVIAIAIGLGGTACSPPEIPVTQAPPSELHLEVLVFDETFLSGATNYCAVQIKEAGKVVVIDDNDSITCGGELLRWNPGLGVYEGRMMPQPAGGGYEIELKTSQGVGTAKIEVPARPEITRPTYGQAVSHNDPLTVEYVPAHEKIVQVWAYDANSGDTTKGEQPDDGVYPTLDVSMFHAGDGHITLARDLEFNVTPTSFQAVHVRYRTTREIRVVWT
jgi:hypothetical protein